MAGRDACPTFSNPWKAKQKGYTVYDPTDNFAMVQIRRGQDDATLAGMEIFMDFNGTGYKTTLRAPVAGGLKRYVFNMSDLSPKAQGYTSVAPIFSERGREFVGAITSNVLIPYAEISLNISQLVLDLGDDGDGETFVIVMNKTETEQELYCDPDLEDPWGGCPVAWDEINWVQFLGSPFAIYFNDVEVETSCQRSPKVYHPWSPENVPP